MITDWMRNLEIGIPKLLEDGIKLLVYAGEYDLICNWLGKLLNFVPNIKNSPKLRIKAILKCMTGNSRWVHAMEWSGQEEFVGAPTKPFTVDGQEAGLAKSNGPLTFLKVHNAGHMVPMDQPKASLEMLQRWIHGKSPLAARSLDNNDLSPM